MSDYQKQCWYCGSNQLEKKDGYVQCANCGATYNDVPSLSSPPITLIDAKTGKAPRRYSPTRARPHGTIMRQAARARRRA